MSLVSATTQYFFHHQPLKPLFYFLFRKEREIVYLCCNFAPHFFSFYLNSFFCNVKNFLRLQHVFPNPLSIVKAYCVNDSFRCKTKVVHGEILKALKLTSLTLFLLLWFKCFFNFFQVESGVS